MSLAIWSVLETMLYNKLGTDHKQNAALKAVVRYLKDKAKFNALLQDGNLVL